MRSKDLANCKYLFSYKKYKTQYISITDTYLSNKTLKYRDLNISRYLFFYLKYEV